MVSRCADYMLRIRVKHDNVSVLNQSQSSPCEDKGRTASQERSKRAARSDSAKNGSMHAAAKHEAQPVLDSGATIRNLGEIISSQFLLFLETEWAMIG